MTERENKEKDEHKHDYMWRIGMYDCALINYAWALKEFPDLKGPVPICTCKICDPRGYKF